jgi:UDP-N-acetylmuramoyl-tripeptide--D-alanyl-D-alanine ligase
MQVSISSIEHQTMERFTVGDILKATGGSLVKGSLKSNVGGISTDSRTLEQDDLFVALIGERFDGHEFIPQAVEQGAAGLVVSKDVGDSPVEDIVLVGDTLQALGDIARLYRKMFDIPLVGITGSNGKTTTKDMTASILSHKYQVLKNEGNLNNAIGVPMTLFRLSRAHEIAIIEMGTGSPGEMSHLVEVAQPDVAVVTNIGPTHLEFFGSVDAVAIEKGLLVQAASSVVLNADDPRSAKMRDLVDGRAVLFGLEQAGLTGKDVLAADIGQDQYGRPEFTLVTGKGRIRVHLPSLGKHNIYNALAAASVGILFNVPLDGIRNGLELYEGASKRMQEVILDGVRIIDDTYNSNPVSLRAAVDFLSQLECDGKRIAVIGDMLELGEQSDELHREAGSFIAGSQISTLVTVGDKASRIAEGALSDGFSSNRIFICGSNTEASERLRQIMDGGDIVLIKGSRGMKMEEIVESLGKL